MTPDVKAFFMWVVFALLCVIAGVLIELYKNKPRGV